MALYSNKMTKQTLSPGARGEMFQVNMPGFRNGEDRISRTNMQLSMADHDALNIKYELDRRLPVLFKAGFAVGYNQIVVPKGRIMAIDPHMNQLDLDTKKVSNVLTLANGGQVVKLEEGKTHWTPVVTTSTVVDGAVIVKEGEKVIGVDAASGQVTVDGVIAPNYRLANRPVGMIMRNEYTRNDDAFNGIQPGAIVTDKVVELPLFLTADSALGNPWGSVYGAVVPGDYVKSDADGRLIPSPLNSLALMAAAGIETAAQVEIERQQIVGQIVEVKRDLVPAGAARFAQWALEDRMNFDLLNPYTYRGNGRDGEDINERAARQLKGTSVNGATSMTEKDFEIGYPYDQTLTQHDLHMLGSTLRKNDLRFGLQHQYENGIPGLTDGYNAVVTQKAPEKIAELGSGLDGDLFTKMSDVNLEKGSVEVALTTKSIMTVTDADFTKVLVEGQTLAIDHEGTKSGEIVRVKFMDELQGLMVLEGLDKEAIKEFLKTKDLTAAPVNVIVRFKKRGKSGVPTFMDWDGCQGSVSVLLQK